MVIKENKKKCEAVVKAMKDIYGDDSQITVYNGMKKVRGMPDFTMLFQAINVTISKLLKPATCKILLYLMSKTEYDNYVGINVETIMEELELSESSVIRGIKQLVDHKIIITTKDLADKRRNVYFINPHQSWKGNYKKRINIVSGIDKKQLAFNFEEHGEQQKQLMLKDIDNHYKNK